MEHLKNHQFAFKPFADYCTDINLFPGDNFYILGELKSQQRLIVALSIIYWERNEGGEWTPIRLRGRSDSALESCDFRWPANADGIGSCLFVLGLLELKSL